METMLNPPRSPFYKGDAFLFEAGLIYSPSYMGEAPMLEAGLIPPLEKRGAGGFTGPHPLPDGISAFAQRISTHPGSL